MFKARESQRIFKGNKIFNFIFHLVHLERILWKIQEFFNPMSVTQKITINILMNTKLFVDVHLSWYYIKPQGKNMMSYRLCISKAAREYFDVTQLRKLKISKFKATNLSKICKRSRLFLWQPRYLKYTPNLIPRSDRERLNGIDRRYFKFRNCFFR